MTPESVTSYSPDDNCWDVKADSMSEGLLAVRRNDISYCAADSGRVEVAVSGRDSATAVAAVRGDVFRWVDWRDRTKLLFCMRRVLACHFLKER